MFSEDLKRIALWQMGSFAMKGWTYVGLIIPFCLVGMIGTLMYTKEMDILTFGEEQAQSVGVDTSKVKTKLFVFSAILTGGAVSLSGTIGFVDLIAPHVVRKIFGSNHKYVIPMTFIFGLFTVYLVILFSSKIDKTMSNNTIILAWIVFSLFVNA